MTNTNKTLVLDMDGTIVDLYGVKNWLEDLMSENPRPYEIAEPLYPMDFLNGILEFLKMLGWKIVITSWLAKKSSKKYDELVRVAKHTWLDKYEVPYDEIHFVKYGTTKANCTRHLGGIQVLVDDDDEIRKGWTLGETIDAKQNIVEKLFDLLNDTIEQM